MIVVWMIFLVEFVFMSTLTRSFVGGMIITFLTWLYWFMFFGWTLNG